MCIFVHLYLRISYASSVSSYMSVYACMCIYLYIKWRKHRFHHLPPTDQIATILMEPECASPIPGVWKLLLWCLVWEMICNPQALSQCTSAIDTEPAGLVFTKRIRYSRSMVGKKGSDGVPIVPREMELTIGSARTGSRSQSSGGLSQSVGWALEVCPAALDMNGGGPDLLWPTFDRGICWFGCFSMGGRE